MNKALILLVFVCAAVAFDYKTALQKANVSQRRGTRCESLVGDYEISNSNSTFKYAKEGVTYKMRVSSDGGDDADESGCLIVVDEKNFAVFGAGSSTYSLIIAKDEQVSAADMFTCTPKDNEDNKVMYQCYTNVIPDTGFPIVASMDFTKVSNGVLRHGIAVAVLAIVAVVALLL